MGFVHKAFVAAGVGFAASALVGCGSSGRLLSQSESTRLTAQLNSVSSALYAHRCTDAESALSNFQNAVEKLNGVDSTLVSNLNQGASTIEQLTSTQCDTFTQTRTRTATTPTHTATTHTVTTVTTDTYTAPTTTTETTSTYTTPTYSTATTSTTGGGPLTGTTSTATTTLPPSGGQGLGNTSSSTTTPTTPTTATTPTTVSTPDEGSGF
jgi:hypothetical protein